MITVPFYRVLRERNLQIATELFYVFSKKKHFKKKELPGKEALFLI